MIILRNPRFLYIPDEASTETKELKKRQIYKTIKYFIGSAFKNFNWLLLNIKNKKDISIIKIFIRDTDDPKIIDTGIKENNKKK